MAPRHSDTPCFVPPHPDLLARIKTSALRVQGGANHGNVDLKATVHGLGGERRFPGMNDGTIFPKSHFEKPTSIMAMSNAALERTPLKGALK
jgi:immune inhibitor A